MFHRAFQQLKTQKDMFSFHKFHQEHPVLGLQGETLNGVNEATQGKRTSDKEDYNKSLTSTILNGCQSSRSEYSIPNNLQHLNSIPTNTN